MQTDSQRARAFADDRQFGGTSRESIWSVKRGSKSAYYAIFSLLFLYGLGFAVRRQFLGDALIEDRIQSAVEFMGPLAIATAAGAIVMVEMGGQVTVLAEATREWLDRRRERAIAQARAEARSEGRLEERAELLRLLKESNPELVVPDLPPLPDDNGQESAP